VRVKAHLMPSPRRRMTGESLFQCGTLIVGAAGLSDLRTLHIDHGIGFIARPHNRDVTRLIVIVIPVGSDHEKTLIGIALRLNGVAQSSPTLRSALLSEPIDLRIGQQKGRVFGRPEYVDTYPFRSRCHESAAVRMFAGAMFGPFPS
jgi:hypothetical protein